jgi:crossover junction endodeoxyribonuclease RusA
MPAQNEAVSGEDLMKHHKAESEEELEPAPDFLVKVKRTIRFDVSGLPVPQGSTRAFVVKGRPIITSTSKGLGSWRQLVAGEAQRRVSAPIDGPVAVTLSFRLPRPKSAPKKKWIYPSKRPDLDKLVRAVLDAVTQVIISDDSQVVSLTATKDYGPPGVLVQVDEIEV